ncbi:MAG: DUF6017 domain-containing protein [Clostridium sp.]|nr:DUF6017 domain-containing protein [Clostridium sp.]
MSDGCFRAKKGFTVVQNNIARDHRLSLKAKGLFLLIQSYISMPDKEWKKEEFLKMTVEGKSAFDNAWKELKDFGYLKIYITSTGKGTIREYELLDEPVEGKSEIYLSNKKDNENVKSAENKAFVQLPDFQVPGNQEVGNQEPGIQDVGNQEPRNQVPGNQYVEIKTNDLNTKLNKTKNTLTLVSNKDQNEEEDIEALVKKNIDYDKLIKNHCGNVQLIKYIVELMSRVLDSSEKYIYVSREKKKIEEVKKRFREIRHEHIESLLHSLPEQDNDIRLKNRYMVTCLYNSIDNVGAICKTNQIKNRGYMHQEYDFDELYREINIY